MALILWHVDLLLGDDCRIANVQQLLLSNDSANKSVSMAAVRYNNNDNPHRHKHSSDTATMEWCFLRGLCRDVISGTISESQVVK
jgi:hypothetical protein